MTIKIRNIFLSILAFLSLLTFATPAYADYGQWGVNNPSSAGEIQTIPEGYGLTAIGYGSDDHKCVIGIQTAPINADGSVDFRFADFTWRMTYCSAGAPDSGRSANIKYFNPVSGDIVTGWTWGADTSGGKPGNNDSPPDECFYQEYINLQTKLIGYQYNGSCSSRGYNVPGELKAVARAPSGRVITGIYFNLDDDAKPDFLAMTTRTVKTASLAVSTNSLIQNQFDLSPSAPTASGVISNVNTTNGGSFTITDCPYISETLFKYSISIQCPIGQSVTTNKPFSVSVIGNPGTSGSATFQVQATGENATVVNPSSETVTVNYVVSSQPQTPVTPVNGTCQKPPDGAILSSAPSGTICETGTASSVSGSGPWNWTCAGSNGGANAQCSAQPTATTCQLTASGASNNAKTITEGESVYWAVSSVPSGLPYFWYVSGSSIQNDVPGEWGGRTDTSGTYTYNTRGTYDVYFNVKNTNGAVTCTSNKVTLTVKPKIVVQPLPPPPPPPPTGLSCSPATQTDRSSPYEFSFKASGGSNNSLYSWTNNNICTVLSNNGESYSIRCSPISNGEATVTAGSETARCCFGAGFDSQCEEEETPTPPSPTTPPVCPVASVTLSSNMVNVGGTVTASAPGFSGGSFSYTSSSRRFGNLIRPVSISPSGDTATITGRAVGTTNISGSGWNNTNGATGCSLGSTLLTITPAPLPDLTAGDPIVTFTDNKNTTVSNVSGLIKNISNTNVSTSFPNILQIDLNNNNSVDQEMRMSHTTSLPSNTNATLTFSGGVLPTLPTGTHSARLCADLDLNSVGSRVSESNESNNCGGGKIFTVNTALPTAPSNLQASNATCGQIRLTWQDNSNNEQGFQIWRGTSQIVRQYAGVEPNVTSYTDTNVNTFSSHNYIIVAYNQAGQNLSNSVGPITPTSCRVSCPSGTVTLSSSSINVGRFVTASPMPSSFSGGSFVSNNTGVATVVGNRVTGLNSGQAEIRGAYDWTNSNGATACQLSPVTLTITTPPPTQFSVTVTKTAGGTVTSGENPKLINCLITGTPACTAIYTNGSTGNQT